MSRRPSPLARVAPTGVVLLAAAAPALQAQSPSRADSVAAARRGFADSWFWGVKGGAARFGTVTDGNKIAGLAGFDWLITRSKAALLIGAEQSFFSHTSAVAEPGSPGFARVVDLKNARRFSASVLAVPGRLGPVRPYAGVGLALDVMREVTPRGDVASAAHASALRDEMDDGSSKASLLLLAGGQVQFGRAAFFVQGNGTPAQTRTLWNRGGVMQLEAGFRYNLSPSREE
ncbi:hypothetical protein [Roseisolibacter sp. H3M3-2]|uniref:hypothetical protein n=1 Tax=Roseisolibacter sp. H3M3-2 TaxID=3031323 RepID=UPI0023DA2E9D|nr:hypothetical protein [Roseisolibacter sp. H3M3-2]MDF1506041.1 hypothetical protein [Roseisolibacter sp. H3M3-2]